MKTKILASIVAITMIVIFGPTSSFAFEEQDYTEEKYNNQFNNEYKITSMEELKQEIETANENDDVSKAEAKEILSEVEPEVMKEYIEFVDDTVSTEVNNSEPDKVMYDSVCDKSTEIYYIDVDGLSKAELTITDQEEQTPIQKQVSIIKETVCPSVYAATNGERKWKYYNKDGSKKARYFTAKYKRCVGLGYGVFCTENHYYVSSSGIQERYGDSWVSTFVGVTVEVTGTKDSIEDKWAKSEGEDAHIKTRWNLKQTVGYEGNNVYHYYTIYERTKIKYIKKDSDNHRIKVEHTWSKI